MSILSFLFGSDDMPPLLNENQELTDEGYIIDRNDDGEIERVVNWDDYNQREIEEEEPPWLSWLFG